MQASEDDASSTASSGPDPSAIEDYRSSIDSLSWMSMAEQDAVVHGLPTKLRDKFFKAMRLLEPVACALASRRIALEVRQEIKSTPGASTARHEANEGSQQEMSSLFTGSLGELPTELQIRIAHASQCTTLGELPSRYHCAIARAALEDPGDVGRLLSASRLFHHHAIHEAMRHARQGWVRRWLRIDGLPDGADVPLHGRRFNHAMHQLKVVLSGSRRRTEQRWRPSQHLMLLDDDGKGTRGTVFILFATAEYAEEVVTRMAEGAFTAEDDYWILNLPDPPELAEMKRSPFRTSRASQRGETQSLRQRSIVNAHTLRLRVCQDADVPHLTAAAGHCIRLGPYELDNRCAHPCTSDWDEEERATAGAWLPRERIMQQREQEELMREHAREARKALRAGSRSRPSGERHRRPASPDAFELC